LWSEVSGPNPKVFWWSCVGRRSWFDVRLDLGWGVAESIWGGINLSRDEVEVGGGIQKKLVKWSLRTEPESFWCSYAGRRSWVDVWLDLGWGVAENTGEGLNRTEMKWRLVWDSEKACEVKSQDRTRKFLMVLCRSTKPSRCLVGSRLGRGGFWDFAVSGCWKLWCSVGICSWDISLGAENIGEGLMAFAGITVGPLNGRLVC
jgi:hypothetical protein